MKKTLLVLAIFLSGWRISAQPVDTLKILSYNVRNCKGLDDAINYERVAKVIRRINADVVALQELDSATSRSGRVVVLDELARLTGMFPSYRASISYQGGKYGIGILTKTKPIRNQSVSLPGEEEARSVLFVEMDKFVIGCSHFSLTQADRLKSVELVNQLASGYSKPVFLAGDLNAEPTSPEIVKFAQDWKILNNTAVPTIPANQPTKCIDFVLAQKNKKFRFEVLKSVVESEPVASDHLPVWVEVMVISN